MPCLVCLRTVGGSLRSWSFQFAWIISCLRLLQQPPESVRETVQVRLSALRHEGKVKDALLKKLREAARLPFLLGPLCGVPSRS